MFLPASGGGDNLLFSIETALEDRGSDSALPTAQLPASLHGACRKETFQINIEDTYKCSPLTSHCRCFKPRESDNEVFTLSLIIAAFM